ncbi:MAG: hypothetical protein ACTSW1_04700 [Candidatus Hodarchaeales archaeon]
MSYDGLKDQDLELKLLVSSYLWNLGYICRPCVYLYHYSGGRRTSKTFTDIDVLGLKFDSNHEPRLLVCSAKAGKESDPHQIFWLSGVKQYFSANNAIYIAEKASTTSVSELCKKLDIVSLNRDELYRLCKTYDVDLNNPRYLNTLDCYKKTNQLFSKLKKYNRYIYNYLTETYWIDRLNHRVLRTITCIIDLKKLDINNEEKSFYIYYSINLFIMALIQIINKLSNIPNGLFLNSLETELLGGEYSEKEKRVLVDKISALLKQYTLLLQTASPVPLKNVVDYDKLLKIAHDEQLYDLSIRLRELSKVLPYLPQILDVITFEIIQPSFDKIDDTILFDIRNYSEQEKNMIKSSLSHILIFFERIGVFKRDEIKLFLDL